MIAAVAQRVDPIIDSTLAVSATALGGAALALVSIQQAITLTVGVIGILSAIFSVALWLWRSGRQTGRASAGTHATLEGLTQALTKIEQTQQQILKMQNKDSHRITRLETALDHEARTSQRP